MPEQSLNSLKECYKIQYSTTKNTEYLASKKNISRSRKMQENDQLIETNPYIGERIALGAKKRNNYL